jgi:hypothetical protein
MFDTKTVVWLLAFFLGSALAQGTAPTLLTPGATEWFLALSAVVALGVPTTKRVVDFLRSRPFLRWFAQGERVLILSFAVATGWVLFMFQPGILNVSAFDLLPAWQSYLFSIVLIGAYAGGIVDGADRTWEAQ